MAARDWAEWHNAYDRPGSSLAQRLVIVQAELKSAIDAQPAGPINIVSICAGQGRDVIDVVGRHKRRDDVRARLVELDRPNVVFAVDRAAQADLTNVAIVEGDASVLDAYRDAVPANIVLVCGVFGNVSDDDIRCTIEALPMLCAPDAIVIWTRHRRTPDLTPMIRAWFEHNDFVELTFHDPEGAEWVGVGANLFDGEPQQLDPSVTMFTFVDDPIDPPR